MNDASTRPLINAEDVTVGDKASRLSSAVFCLLCVLPVFATLLYGGVDNATWIFITVLWTLIVLLWLAESWRLGGILLNPSSLQIPIAGLILIALIQLLPLSGGVIAGVVTDPAWSLDQYSTRLFLTRLVVYLTFFAACLAFINTASRLNKVVIGIIIFGAAMAFFGILQRLANPDGIYGLRQTPAAIPFGPFVNQHHFAALMQMTAGLALGLLFGREMPREKQVLLAAAVVVMGVAVVFTGSRGGLLAFGSVIAFITLLEFLSGRWSSQRDEPRIDAGVRRKFVLVVSGAALFAIMFGLALLLGGNDNLLRGIGVGVDNVDFSTGRLHFWPIALRIFLDHPILGAGFESFGIAFTRHDTWNGFFRVEQAHNEYLQMLADAGIAGFACVAAFIYLLFKKGLARIAASSEFRRASATGALAGCFGILIHSFFDFPLRTSSNAFFFLMLCAIATVPVAAIHKRRRRHRSASEH